jgi:outer membrane protein assembly factor BamB
VLRPPGQWSMFMNGPQRRGRTRILGAQSSNLAWRISTETNGGGPAVGLDGTIYQGTDFGELLALNPDGSLKWRFLTPFRVNTTPAFLLDGRIASVDEGGNLFVLNPDGSLSWEYQTGTAFTGPGPSPAVGWDGTIYTGIWNTVYAFHPDGSIRWTYSLSGRMLTGPVAVKKDGTVYGTSGRLFALDADGILLWKAPAPIGGLGGAPAIAPDGTIYVNSGNTPTFYAFSPDGSVKWSHDGGSCCSTDVPSSPAIGGDGSVYVGENLLSRQTLDGVIWAFDADGTLAWEAHQGESPTALSVGADGTLYFGAISSPGNGGLWALNPDGTLKWEFDDSGGAYVRTPPAIGAGHRLYAGSLTGFFAIGP